jgi:hypothetical protein
MEEGILYMVFEHLEYNLTDFMRDLRKEEGRALTENEIKIIIK